MSSLSAPPLHQDRKDRTVAHTKTAFVTEVKDDASNARTQVILIATEGEAVVYRRSLLEGQKRTHWKPGKVANGPGWLSNFVTMSSTVNGAKPSFATVIEVTDEELSESLRGTLPRNVGLRYDRARKHALGTD